MARPLRRHQLGASELDKRTHPSGVGSLHDIERAIVERERSRPARRAAAVGARRAALREWSGALERGDIELAVPRAAQPEQQLDLGLHVDYDVDAGQQSRARGRVVAVSDDGTAERAGPVHAHSGAISDGCECRGQRASRDSSLWDDAPSYLRRQSRSCTQATAGSEMKGLKGRRRVGSQRRKART